MNKDKPQQMNLDQQIKYYEDCIARLEECKKAISGDPSRICEDLNNAYQQITLLKIRKMMGMKS
ncbi:hypothetical protein ACFLTU_04445 [Bacteroidota bacterium]